MRPRTPAAPATGAHLSAAPTLRSLATAPPRVISAAPGFNANVRLQELVSPEQLISGFAPELIGVPLQDGDVIASESVTKGGLLYYTYELKPKHLLCCATAFKNRLYILTATSTARQWRSADAQAHLRAAVASFAVRTA